MHQRILITGASGRIGTSLRSLLARDGRTLVLTDIVEPAEPAVAGEEFTRAEITDISALTTLAAGADLVVHLGGHPIEAEWERILDTNINGTRTVFEAAYRAGVQRVLFASSVHAVGFASVADASRAEVLHARPDTYYGVSKAAGEAIGSLYADRFGMTVVSARIVQFNDEPTEARSLGMWFAPDDMARLVEAAAVLDRPGNHIVWGVSRNTRGWLPLAAGERIGFSPERDAEPWADRFETAATDAPPAGDPALASLRLGDVFTEPSHPIGVDWNTLFDS